MGTIARYTEPAPMSIHAAPLPSASIALMREARTVFARSLGLAVAATLLLVLGGMLQTLPAMAGLVLFTGLAVTAVKVGAVPCWVLAIGGMRYFALGAGRLFSALRRPLPAHPFVDRQRKTIAVVQSLALLCALAPATSPSWAAAVCAAALGLLAYSFAVDIVMRRAPRERPAN